MILSDWLIIKNPDEHTLKRHFLLEEFWRDLFGLTDCVLCLTLALAPGLPSYNNLSHSDISIGAIVIPKVLALVSPKELELKSEILLSGGLEMGWVMGRDVVW